MNEYTQPNFINPIDETPEAGASQTPAPQKRKRSAGSLIVGILVILLAGYGVFQLGSLGVSWLKDRAAEKAADAGAVYYNYLIPVAAIDIDPFEDVTAADMNELVEMAVWGLLNSGLDSTQYVYDGDELLLPEMQVEASFVHFFGSQRTIQHTTVEGYGYRFTYDAAGHVYRIPLTTITPLYTPVITETETKGDSTVLTVGYLNTGLYALDPLTGELSAPQPDKFVKVTLRAAAAGTYISAVRSMGVPEVAATLPVYTTAAPGEETQAETEAETGDESDTEAEDETEEASGGEESGQ